MPLDRNEQTKAAVVSAALGAGVGLVAFYFIRLMLSREPLELGAREAPEERRLEE
jgi:hypothetical protein